MVNKRGLSPDEYYDLPDDLLEALMIYDQRIEPSGLQVQSAMFANLCHLIMMTSPNLSEKGRKEAKPKDWDLFGTFENLTASERQKKREEEEKEQKAQNIKKSFRELMDMEKGKKNGKQQ
ncbi:hypothetical protein [Serratia marcescens]|uniref:hypothetical protein n=1 Tax=Serratia marcescens TaxID=615 RepID=UPI0039893BCC